MLSKYVCVCICAPAFIFAQNDLANLRTCNESHAAAYDKILLEQAWRLVSEHHIPLSPVTVGIIDTGIDANHQEFTSPLVSLSILLSATSQVEHGTAIAGIIGAGSRWIVNPDCNTPSEASHMAGILGGVESLDYRLLNYFVPRLANPPTRPIRDFQARFANALAQLDRNGVNVVNISWGTIFASNAFFASEMSKYPHILFVIAAGNAGADVSGFASRLFAPAGVDLENTITVGATNLYDQRAFFSGGNICVGGVGLRCSSNFGKTVDMAAPGVNIWAPSRAPDAYELWEGTSFSCPMVAGAGALLKALTPSLGPSEIKNMLVESGDPIFTDKWLGGKRLNVCRATKRVLNEELHLANSSPVRGASDVDPSTAAVTATFSLALDPSSVSGLRLRSLTGEVVNAEVQISDDHRTILIVLGSGMKPNTAYLLDFAAEDAEIRDACGDALDPNSGPSDIFFSTASLPPPPTNPPTCNLTASPPTITQGDSSTLEWTTTSAPTSAVIGASPPSDVGPASPPTGGSKSVWPASTTTYTMTVQNGAGSGECQATVTVNAIPQLSFSVSDLAVSFSSLWMLAPADFDGNARLDFAVITGTRIFIMLGNGDGTFVVKTNFSTGLYASVWAATGDFNQDASQDLAVVNSYARAISVFLGNGDGTFGPKTDIALPGRNESIVAADFNRDGKLDLAAPNFEPAPYTVSVLLGNGDGTFGPHLEYATGDVPFVLATNDFNGDGNVDLGMNGQFGGVTVLLGNGDGTFGPKTVLPPLGYTSSHLIAKDFNDDGKSDLAMVNQDPSTENFVSVFLGDVSGTFVALPPSTMNNAFRLASADFDTDGIPDLAVTTSTPAAVFVLLGKGDGTFAAPIQFDTGLWPYFVVSEDLNGDGKPDLATANSSSGTISILLNTSQ